MYKPHCGHSERRLGGITCLSLTGRLFTIVFTYIGFACMITGECYCQIRTGRRFDVEWRVYVAWHVYGA